MNIAPTQPHSTEEPQRHGLLTLPRVIACCVILISTLQGSYFALATPWTAYTVTALLLAVSTVFFAKRVWSAQHSRVLWVVFFLVGSQLLVVLATFVQAALPLSFRLLLVALALSYLATALTALFASVAIIDLHNAVLLCFSTAIGLFLCETALELPRFGHAHGPVGPEWVGDVSSPHPTLGTIYRPGSALKTYYPDNPRGYFETEDSRRATWALRVAGEGEATLATPSDRPDVTRVAITRAGKAKFDIQLNQPHFKVRAHQPYTIDVTARADSARSITVGFAMAHEPAANLGLYQTIELTSNWQRFQLDFSPIADEDDGRIHFDAGDSDVSFELSSVALRTRPAGALVAPDRSHRSYYVSYRFNSLGCRGRDYEIPRPAKTGRIVLLGDSFTLGVGVHDRDTFGSELERLLNEEAKALASFDRYEVINCGVSGFATREERLFYEEFGARYEPQVILLAMVTNDDMSFREEVKRGYVLRSPGRAESLSFIWQQVEDYRHRRPLRDYRRSIADVRRLNTLAREHGARLGVIIFRSNGDYGGDGNAEMWDYLIRTVTAGLQGTDIPLLDLGPVLLAQHPGEQLLVHEIDGHPNEVAHRTAARAILKFVLSKQLLRPR